MGVPLLTSILILIVVSRLLGELMVRIGQTRIVGELLCGILVGPAILNIVEPTRELQGISELSVFLIVLSAGLEMEFREVLTAIRGRGLIAAFLDFLIPLGAGLAIGSYFKLDLIPSLILGLCVSITALPVAIRIMSDFKLLNSKIARYSIATAILNDVAALLLLGIILSLPKGSPVTHASLPTIFKVLLMSSAKLVAFALVVFGASRLFWWGGSRTHYIQQFVEKLMSLFGPETLFGVSVLFVLGFGSFAEQLGSHFVIGAFFGALLLSKDLFGSSLFSNLEATLKSITSGFLAPIFLAYLGLHVSGQSLRHPLFLVIVVLASVASKILAGYVGARWIRFSRAEALGVGIILNGRGIMELVVANIALQKQLISQELFSVLVIMGIFTTVATPILFRMTVLNRLRAAGLARSK